MSGILISTLPKTLHDAVVVIKALQVQQLWVDSLCIVQNDPDEVAQEIAQMPEYYEGAWATIMTASALDPQPLE